MAKFCYGTLLEYGAAAKIASENRIVTPALERVIEANILLSGLGFESAGLASALSIHNGLTALAETHSFYHGEKLAFGVLAGLQVTDASPQESRTVFAFCEEVGLPTTLAEIGLGNASREELDRGDARVRSGRDRLSYQLGVINGFRDKLSTERKELRGTGLVWVGDKQLDAHYHARHPRITTRSSTIRLDGAHAAGREAGRKVVLHRPVENGPSRGRRLLRG